MPNASTQGMAASDISLRRRNAFIGATHCGDAIHCVDYYQLAADKLISRLAKPVKFETMPHQTISITL
jgi:hypothetical protein